VHVGTSCWWPAAVRPGDPARSSAANIAGFVRQIERAAKLGVELLVLPEGMTVVGVPGGSYSSVAEAPDGPATRALAAAAKRHRMHVIACYNLRVAEHITNTATLFGPNGKILGRYDKVHVPNEEVDGGVVEGRSFPVFETALGTIGMMICWDVVFPEAARALALRGAEIIALPIWGGQELLMQARALENHVYLLSSGFDARNTIVDPQGRLLANQAAVKGSERVAKILHANIDLAAPHRWPWVGDFAHRWPFERRGV
ncbi:MAG: carbon-nitrogen hydrolase family protein, partial [Planctomycetota bacterium]